MKAIRQYVQFRQSLPHLINPQFLGIALLLLVLLLLSGCGEDAFVCDSTDCTTSSNNTTTTTTTIPSNTSTTNGEKIGNGIGANFVEGLLDTGGVTNFVENAQATVSVSIVNADNTAYGAPIAVTFSTTCATSNLNPISTPTASGIAQTTYTAGTGCTTDTITASATVNGENISAARTVTITANTSNILLGSGSTTTFAQGVLELTTGNVAAGQALLAQGGSTTVTATVVDADAAYALYTTASVDIIFSSACVDNGLATMQQSSTTIGGIATVTYTAAGCSGDDVITAQANINGVLFQANVTVTVAPASIGSMQFLGADPPLIALQGAGNAQVPEFSNLSFLILDTNGNPVVDQVVDFSLNTTIGGIDLTTFSAVTGADGTVTTTVLSGTISTPVTVTATAIDANTLTPFSTQSDALVISTGWADYDSFSISVSSFLPEATGYNGETVQVTIHAADHFNNPVPDNTAISFTTEGGAIESSCLTVGGTCSVTWTSQNPRPPQGRSTILAYATGNESYTDLNSNGRFDDGDIQGADLPEAFLDVNENGVYDAAYEEYRDFNQDGSYSNSDGGFTGVLCAHSTACATATSLNVYASTVITMADSFFNVTVTDTGATGPTTNVTTTYGSGTPINVSAGDVTVRVWLVGTSYGTYPPAGTTILVGDTIIAKYIIPNVVGPGEFTVSDAPPGFTPPANAADYPTIDPGTVSQYYVDVTLTSSPGSDNFFLEITTPKGNQTYPPVIPITN